MSRLAITGERRSRFLALPDNIVVADISKGIPFPDGSVDAVYHSHLVEHIDRPDAPTFFREVFRVLKPGGIHRSVAPDFEYLCRMYLRHVDECDRVPAAVADHDDAISAVIEQMVRKAAVGTQRQRQPRRAIESLVLGDARRRGHTHQWMYDRHNLRYLYQCAGFTDVTVTGHNQSAIERWTSYRLEVDEYDNEYKPHSVYVEGRRPAT